MADKEFFEKIFKKKDFEFTYPFDKELVQNIVKYKKNGKILDLGCGEGGLTIELAKRGFSLQCIDISKTTIDNLKNKKIGNDKHFL